MKKLVYLTFNDAPGGIFSSQVIEVCKFMEQDLKQEVRLISFVSIRNFFSLRRTIRDQFAGSLVLPMWPGIEHWQKNKTLLGLVLWFIHPSTIIARGPFAAILAKKSSRAKICFDARGAYKAEFEEYDVGGGKITASMASEAEREALQSSDFRIAVSQALVDYWKKEYGYTENRHVVIPCTLSAHHTINHSGISDGEKIRIVFSGGTGKWQSLHLMDTYLLPLFHKLPTLELLMLCKSLPADFELKKQFPSRVMQRWVSEREVASLLAESDYGWLVREDTVTNQVASPVKFAEYLAAGLRVIISPRLGDFSAFVSEHHCGILAGEVDLALSKTSIGEKMRFRKLSENYFFKENYRNEYRKVVE